MLKETVSARQIEGEPFRRWFSDPEFDLIVWYNPDRTVQGFQLCYRFGPEEKALTWYKGRGFSHNRIDDGENRPGRQKMTPVLVRDGTFDAANVLKRFLEVASEIDPEVVRIVRGTISRYPEVDQEEPNTIN